ncbi:hypothetical protein HWD94_03945 [Pseudarthrobacter equi]|uniref:hypothetical protein n=1 Tax=Pseudarthrobacter equi TaxID=728066 RepID=UPI0021BF3135|nr:hypothetical protein [Pseudarthrobacter equi]MCT9624275.1 hypothetical protein [Pseudarthrobacter equi]
MSEYDDPELAAAARAAARSRRSDKRWKLLLTVVSLLLAAVTIVAASLAFANGRLASENAEFAATQQGEKKQIASEARQALCGAGEMEIYDQQLCEKWADAAQEPTVTPQTPAAVPGAGPTQAQIVQAFREYCADGNCRGRDGSEPTPEDIAQAFAEFCADGRCTGPAGSAGTNGNDGAAAAPPTPEMMLAAVTTYCADGRCIGPKGDQGNGPTADNVFAAVAAYCGSGACTGPPGQPGADSTVPGPKGDTGPPPAQFTFKDQTGRTQTCVPDPPGSATYTCTAEGLIP